MTTVTLSTDEFTHCKMNGGSVFIAEASDLPVFPYLFCLNENNQEGFYLKSSKTGREEFVAHQRASIDRDPDGDIKSWTWIANESELPRITVVIFND